MKAFEQKQTELNNEYRLSPEHEKTLKSNLANAEASGDTSAQSLILRQIEANNIQRTQIKFKNVKEAKGSRETLKALKEEHSNSKQRYKFYTKQISADEKKITKNKIAA